MPVELEARAHLMPRNLHRVDHLPILILHVHSSCNCRCVMCDIWKTTERHSLRPDELAAQLPSIRALGVKWVVFSGGEPLLNTEFPSLCSLLRNEGIQITLLTTGLVLHRHAETVAGCFDDITISLDGPEKVHDAIRRTTGAYAAIRRGIAAVRSFRPGITIKARATVQKNNFRFLRATVESSRDLGLDGISFLAADLTSDAFNRPGGWSPDRQGEIAISQADLPALQTEIEALIEQFAAEIRSGFIAESPEKLRRIVRHFRAYLGLDQAESPLCNAPWVSAVLEIGGAVRPCFFHPPIGNANHVSLEQVINGQQAMAFRSSLQIPSDEICKRCVCSLNHR